MVPLGHDINYKCNILMAVLYIYVCMYGNPFGLNHVVSGGVPFMYIDIGIDIIIDIALKILPLVRYIPSDIPSKYPTKPIDIHLHHPKMLHCLFFQRKRQFIPSTSKFN